MDIGPESRVGEVAAAHPSALRIFDVRGIDYGNGGERTLREASTKAGLTVEDLVALVRGAAERVAPEVADPGALPLPELVAYVVGTHHAFTRAELERGEALVLKVARMHGARRPDLFELAHVFEAMREDLLVHLHKEEHILFPYVVALAEAKAGGRARPRSGFSSVRYPVQVMHVDHQAHDHGLSRIRALTNDFVPPEDACGSYRSLFDCLRALEADIRRHVDLENHVLFPSALDLEASFG